MKEKTPNPYQIDKFSKIPGWVKVTFLKWWVAGAVYYFVGFGLLFTLTSFIDSVIYLGLLLGIVSEYIVNPVIRWMQKSLPNYEDHIIVLERGVKGLLLNILFGFLFSIIIAMTYVGINSLAIAIFSLEKSRIVLGVEPILYGLFYLAYNILFIKIKHFLFRRKK